MKKSEQTKFKKLLMALRDRLRGEVNHLADSGLTIQNGDLSSMPLHLADMGSDTYEQDFTISLVENGEETLELIDEALERVDEGTFGDCTECGKSIPKARLNAIPYAQLCVNCATALGK